MKKSIKISAIMLGACAALVIYSLPAKAQVTTKCDGPGTIRCDDGRDYNYKLITTDPFIRN